MQAGTSFVEQHRRLDEAVEQFEAALEIRPGLAPVLYSIGTVRSRQGRFDEALVAFQAALEAQPDMLLALLNTGLTLAQAGRHAEAIPKLQAAYNHPEATTPELKVPAGQAMAWIHAVSPDERLHDGLRAQAIIRECIDMSTPNPTLMDVAAAGQARVGAYEEAARTLKRALKVVPPPKQGAMLERLALYEAGKPYTLPSAP